MSILISLAQPKGRTITHYGLILYTNPPPASDDNTSRDEGIEISPTNPQSHLATVCLATQLTARPAEVWIQSQDSNLPSTGLLKMLYSINEYSTVTYKIIPQ
jgi:hypothetical protein